MACPHWPDPLAREEAITPGSLRVLEETDTALFLSLLLALETRLCLRVKVIYIYLVLWQHLVTRV